MDSAARWTSFLANDLFDEANDDALLWCQRQQQQQQQPLSMEDDSSKGNSINQEKTCSKKRNRDEFSSGAGTKSCQEKMRRDRLNDRFMELIVALEPCKPMKMNRASILQDATRILSQLRVETQQLKDANYQLQESIKELKAEKNELRDDKLRLKCENERLERHLKNVNVVPGYALHPSAVHGAAVVEYSSSNQPHATKSTSFPKVPFSLTMSPSIPQATVDNSKDHVLRPPVA